MKLRVKFSKKGPVKFIGHLDVMRFFQKAIRRAEIDIAYSGGYSPHQIMSFAAPLGVGLESNGEYMDIEVHSMVSCEDIRDRLNNASVPGIQVSQVSVLPEKAGNAMASVAAASYHVSFREGKEPHFDLAKAIASFMSLDEVLYTKETKKGTRTFDLRQGIYKFSLEEKGIYLLLDASSAGNIKPIQVMETLFEQNGDQLQQFALLITREEMYRNIGTEDERKLIPLGEISADEGDKRAEV